MSLSSRAAKSAPDAELHYIKILVSLEAMEKKHRKHLKSRKSKAFNTLSKSQEDAAKVASRVVWETVVKKYPGLSFSNFQTLGMKDLNAKFALAYLNRGFKIQKLVERKEIDLQAFDAAEGIKPDGGVFFVQSKKDGFNHIVGALEVKHQWRIYGLHTYK